MSLPKPSRIGRYEIVSVIGRGGMGTVYRATDPIIGRSVAVKVLTGAFGNDPDLLARFYREAKYTGTLQHSNIVTVYELGDQAGLPYLVMEYLEGESLDGVIRSHRSLPLTDKLGIISQVCSGLHFAHQRGVVHRDVKPANVVVLNNGTAKIVDFGIAHVGGNRLTRTGQVVGSFHYMSPEQLNGVLEVDPRTDVYSTGVVLFELLTGVLPFEGRDTGSTLLKIVQDPPPRLGQYLAACPPELEAIVQKALAKNREARYANAEDFGFELSALQRDLTQELVSHRLQEAHIALQGNDLVLAKRRILDVLRVDPQSATASRLLREIQQQIDSNRLKQRVLQLRSEIKDALKGQDYPAALELTEKGLQLLPGDEEFQRLHVDAKRSCDERNRINQLISLAETSVANGDLPGALDAVTDAGKINPDDSKIIALHTRITSLIQENALRAKPANVQNGENRADESIGAAIRTVGVAIADCRTFLYLGNSARAKAALQSAEAQAALVPEDLRREYEQLALKLGEISGEQRGQGSFELFETNDRNGQGERRPSESATTVFGHSTHWEPDLHSTHLREVPADTLEESVGIPDDLKEFLPPPRSKRARIVLLAAICVILAAFGLVESTRLTTGKHPAPPTGDTRLVAAPDTGSVSFAEINAEPWGTVKAITSLDGARILTLSEQTPVRLDLPQGEYNVTVVGPSGAEKQIKIRVPSEQQTPYTIVFRKPDVSRVVSLP